MIVTAGGVRSRTANVAVVESDVGADRSVTVPVPSQVRPEIVASNAPVSSVLPSTGAIAWAVPWRSV